MSSWYYLITKPKIGTMLKKKQVYYIKKSNKHFQKGELYKACKNLHYALVIDIDLAYSRHIELMLKQYFLEGELHNFLTNFKQEVSKINKYQTYLKLARTGAKLNKVKRKIKKYYANAVHNAIKIGNFIEAIQIVYETREYYNRGVENYYYY